MPPRLSGWLRSPRTLPALLGLVVAVPAVTLVALGLRLLEQDRALARTRQIEVLESAADRAVRAVEQHLTALTRRLAGPDWQPTAGLAGSIEVLIADAGVRAAPGSAVAWYPTTHPMPEPPATAFAELNAAEMQDGDLANALSISRRLAARPEPPVQAGALLGQASVLRKMGRPADARAAYVRLAAITTVAINGEPADLVARRAMCALARDEKGTATLRDAALALQTDLEAGRWRLDRATYEYAAAQLDDWLGPERRRDGDRERFAAALDWIYQEHAVPGRLPASDARAITTAAGPATVVWASGADRVAAVVALPAFVDGTWRAEAERAASPAVIAFEDAAGPARPRNGEPSDLAATRLAAQTGLPWTLVARMPPGAQPDDLPGRERTLLAALAAVLALAGAGTYLVIRARGQEIALARLQSDFVSAVSHEFRTPLTALRQFNDLLADEHDLPDAKRREYHRAQTRATERLHRLVESLLDFGRMEAGRRPYAFQRLDAGALVRDVVEEFRAELDGRGFDIGCRIDAGDHTIQADPEALGRAIWNVLDNAVKYSGDGRRLDVSVTQADRGPGPTGLAVAIAVRDCGIGIPRQEQARIFQKFVRGANPAAAAVKGTGIGLAMAQHIVSAHRGRIGVESEPGRGSTFTIVLPNAGQT